MFFGFNFNIGQNESKSQDIEDGTAETFPPTPLSQNDYNSTPPTSQQLSQNNYIPSPPKDIVSETDSVSLPKPPVVRKPKKDGYLSVLSECLNGAGQNAFGVAAIEVWTLQKNELVRSRDGYWRDPVFPETPNLERLENTSHPQHVATERLVPGLGVAGTIWANVYGNTKLGKWFDLKQLSQDEDQPFNLRLNILAEAFGLATGMYFNNANSSTKGIVVFYARGTVNFDLVSSPSNLEYLRSSTDLIGGVVSWENPRENAIKARKGDLAATCRRVRSKLLALKRIGALHNFDAEKYDKSQRKNGALAKAIAAHEEKVGLKSQIVGASIRLASFVEEKSSKTVSKMVHGGRQSPPPRLARNQVIFALMGCFLSLFTLSGINELIKDGSDNDLSILLGPLGALVTCHYGLTSAPASQPRNSVLSIIFTSTLAQASTEIPTDILPVWVRMPLVASIGIACTLAMGLAHPPAGAVAIIFAKGDRRWHDMGLLLFAYVEAIFFAMVFINMHESKTFPMYWGVRNPREWFCPKSEKSTN
mmetsp:Transcript_62310/g.72878  ORF Transcript_62310/g.72878 Transcript_62310/m.72878 type:complete len:533 (+) Transcript_62310:249-1847(+)